MRTHSTAVAMYGGLTLNFKSIVPLQSIDGKSRAYPLPHNYHHHPAESSIPPSRAKHEKVQAWSN